MGVCGGRSGRVSVNIGDRVRVKSEPELGVLVVRALFTDLMPMGETHVGVVEFTRAECSTNGKPPGRSFRVDDLEVQP